MASSNNSSCSWSRSRSRDSPRATCPTEHGSPMPMTSRPLGVMDMFELEYWMHEQEIRMRTEGLTAMEVQQLMDHPTITDARTQALSICPQPECHSELLAWAAELSKDAHRTLKVPGTCVTVKTPLWSLAKGLYFAELRMSQGRPHMLHGCHCLPNTAFMLHGCECELDRDPAEWQFLGASNNCPTCSRCLRCQKPAPQRVLVNNATCGCMLF